MLDSIRMEQLGIVPAVAEDEYLRRYQGAAARGRRRRAWEGLDDSQDHDTITS